MATKLDQTHTTCRIGSKVKYEGALAEPLPKPSPNWSDEQRADWQAKWAQNEIRLMQFHRIDPTGPDARAKLLIALEISHVPGLRYESPKQGRPCERAGDDLLYWQLLEFEKRRCFHSERRVSKIIASLGIIEGSAETLRTRNIKWKRKVENREKIQAIEYFANVVGEDFVIGLFRKLLGNNLRKLNEKYLLIASQKMGPVRVIPPNCELRAVPPNGKRTQAARRPRSRA
jgi:hypothetical protein